MPDSASGPPRAPYPDMVPTRPGGGVVPAEPARDDRADDKPRTSPPERHAALAHGSLVDAHVGRYSARAKDMAASEIRALFAVAARPEIVSLAGGMPYVTALPLDAVGDMAGHL